VLERLEYEEAPSENAALPAIPLSLAPAEEENEEEAPEIVPDTPDTPDDHQKAVADAFLHFLKEH
jgi:hypothetical protein